MKTLSLFFLLFIFYTEANPQSLLKALKSPVLFQGNATTAYRDPAVLVHEQTFYLFFTLVEIEGDGKVFSYTATSQSRDLKNIARDTPPF